VLEQASTRPTQRRTVLIVSSSSTPILLWGIKERKLAAHSQGMDWKISTGANTAILIGSVIVFFGSFALIRTQTTIGDRAFLRSMIPHHSGAILMCSEASISDPEVVALCGQIIKSQRDEIEQMKAILGRM
jgi:uncharacterized protein (DUF305 family)